MQESQDETHIRVEVSRIERIRDVLAMISLGEFDPARDLFVVDQDDEFASFESTIHLFARQLHASVTASENAIRNLDSIRVDLEEKLSTIERQRKAIRELSTPVLELWDDVLTLPILGEIDRERSRDMTDSLLSRIAHSKARCAIIDVTGVPTIDTATADALIRMVAAAKMLGAYCVVTGISPGVAETLTQIGVSLSGIETLGTLRDGQRACFRFLRAREERSRRRHADAETTTTTEG